MALCLTEGAVGGLSRVRVPTFEVRSSNVELGVDYLIIVPDQGSTFKVKGRSVSEMARMEAQSKYQGFGLEMEVQGTLTSE